MNKKNLLLSIIPVITTSIISSYFTTSSVNSEWYKKIKPSFTPPNFLFPIIWTIIYLSLIYILYNTLQMGNTKLANVLLVLITINLLLNILWCFIFFYLKNTLHSIIVILLLLINIIVLIYMFFRNVNNIIIKIQLLLYLSWIILATILNFTAHYKSS